MRAISPRTATMASTAATYMTAPRDANAPCPTGRRQRDHTWPSAAVSADSHADSRLPKKAEENGAKHQQKYQN